VLEQPAFPPGGKLIREILQTLGHCPPSGGVLMVYDLDGDGRAEVACKTADGTVDGRGNAISDPTKDYRSLIVPTDGVQVPDTSDQREGCNRHRRKSRHVSDPGRACWGA
jgi:hypothetical protein